MSARVALLALVLCAAPACAVFHLDKHAPGAGVIQTPPANLDAEQAEEPEDPGESITRLTVGPYGYIGGAFPRGQSSVLVGEFGLELSLAGWEREESHRAEDHYNLFVPGLDLYSLNLAWGAFQAIDETRLGPIFVEAQAMFGTDSPFTSFGGALGVGADISQRSLSAQATLLCLMGSNGLRVRYTPDGEGLSIGWYVTYKLPLVWARSR
jgi:hypothetical protein